MSSRVSFWALGLALLFTSPAHAFDACAPDTAAHYTPIAERYAHALLFKIEKCGVPDSYIFGTYHSDDPALLKNATAARSMMAQSSLLLFEYIDPANAGAITERYMFLPLGSDLRTLVGEDRFSRILALLQTKFPNITADTAAHMQPWAMAVITQYPKKTDDGNVLDDRLKKLGLEQHKTEAGLETLESQMLVFATLTQEQQLQLLNDTLDYRTQGEAIEQEVETAYREHDLARINALVPKSLSLSSDPVFTNMMLDRLIYKRNAAMGKVAIARLKDGHVFIAIGALHLPGTTGLLKQFEAAGYFIEPAE